MIYIKTKEKTMRLTDWLESIDACRAAVHIDCDDFAPLVRRGERLVLDPVPSGTEEMGACMKLVRIRDEYIVARCDYRDGVLRVTDLNHRMSGKFNDRQGEELPVAVVADVVGIISKTDSDK